MNHRYSYINKKSPKHRKFFLLFCHVPFLLKQSWHALLPSRCHIAEAGKKVFLSMAGRSPKIMLCITHVKFKKCSSPNKIFELYKRYAKDWVGLLAGMGTRRRKFYVFSTFQICPAKSVMQSLCITLIEFKNLVGGRTLFELYKCILPLEAVGFF